MRENARMVSVCAFCILSQGYASQRPKAGLWKTSGSDAFQVRRRVDMNLRQIGHNPQKPGRSGRWAHCTASHSTIILAIGRQILARLITGFHRDERGIDLCR